MNRYEVKKTWGYTYVFTKHYGWLAIIIILVLITNGIIAAVLGVAGAVFGGGALNMIIENSFVFWMIIGLYALSCGLSMLVYKGKYRYEYRLTEYALNTRAGVGIVPFSHEMTVNSRIGREVRYVHVSRLTLLREKNEIRIRGTMILTSVFAYDEDIDEVWEILKTSCTKAKVFE